MDDLKQRLDDISSLEGILARLKAEAAEKYPDQIPRCHFCNGSFHEGWHSRCCGAM